MGIIDDVEWSILMGKVKTTMGAAHDVVAKRRALNAANKYGADKDLVLSKMMGGCEICGFKPSNLNEALVADHNHDSGEFRGALCYSCNTGIGLLGDDVEVLSKAIKYLNERGSYAKRDIK